MEERWIMNIASRFIFWVKPEHREAKLSYIVGARTLTGFIRAVGPSRKLIEELINTIMKEMGMDREATLRAIAKVWGIDVVIRKEVRHGKYE